MPAPHLLDANAVSDAMKGHPKLAKQLTARTAPVCTSVIVQGEIQYGLKLLTPGKRRRDLEAKAASILGSLSIEAVTERIAVQYADTRAALEKQGVALG